MTGGRPSANGELAARYLDALRDGKPQAAMAATDAALRTGADIAAIHCQMIDPAMKMIGELWARDDISIDEEHLATEICQKVSARLFWLSIGDVPPTRERVVMAAVQGEQHVLGLRLAADVLESAGYDVLYLGADLPIDALQSACQGHDPKVVGLTVMPLNVPTLIRELDQLQKLDRPPRVMGARRRDGRARRSRGAICGAVR